MEHFYTCHTVRVPFMSFGLVRRLHKNPFIWFGVRSGFFHDLAANSFMIVCVMLFFTFHPSGWTRFISRKGTENGLARFLKHFLCSVLATNNKVFCILLVEFSVWVFLWFELSAYFRSLLCSFAILCSMLFLFILLCFVREKKTTSKSTWWLACTRDECDLHLRSWQWIIS